MSVLTIELPDTMLATNALSLDAAAREARLLLAAKWFEMGRLSGGQAAELAGLSRYEFMLAISRMKISPFQEGPEDLARELDGV